MERREIERKFSNAGFKEVARGHTEYCKSKERFLVYVSLTMPFSIRLYYRGDEETNWKQFQWFKPKPESFEELGKELYPFLGELNFENDYTWEKCFNGNGCFLTGFEVCEYSSSVSPSPEYKGIAKTAEDCLSMLAYAQLTHIVAKIEEDFPRENNNFYTFCETDKGAGTIDYIFNEGVGQESPLMVNSLEGAKKLIETNTPLLKQWLKIK